MPETPKSFPPAQPTQTAVGEGELPPLDIDESDGAFAFANKDRGHHGVLEELHCRERQLREERKETQLAIAQRDEAIQKQHNPFCDKSGVPIGSPGCICVTTIRERYDELKASEARLAAATEFKPDEIERLENGFNDWFMENHKRLQLEYQTQTTEPPFKDVCLYAEAAWKYVLSRLRSLPSEPTGKQGVK